MSDQPQPTQRRSFTETAKDALSMAAEKAREMAHYATGAVFNAAETAKEMAYGKQDVEESVPADRSHPELKNLSQPWQISAPSALPGPYTGVTYGCKPVAPEPTPTSHLHALAHPTSSLRTF